MSYLTFTTDESFLPYFAGGICVAFLYGVTTGQAAFYWSRSGKDKKVLRILVSLLWTLDSAHSVLVPCSFYILFAETFHNGNPQIRIQTFTTVLQLWSYKGVFVVTGITDLVVKSIYTYRIWKLSDNKVLAALLSSFALTAFVLSCVSVFPGHCGGSTTQSCFHRAPISGHINVSTITVIVMLACVAASDIAISAMLCILLRKRRTGFRNTERLIRLLVLYSIEVGILTSVVSAGSLVTFVLVGYNSAAFVSTFWVVPKFSINSLLALLNARRRLREVAVFFVAPSMNVDSLIIDENLHPVEPRAGRRVRQASRLVVTRVGTAAELDGDPRDRFCGHAIEMVPVITQPASES